jgi:hypothetical protein
MDTIRDEYRQLRTQLTRLQDSLSHSIHRTPHHYPSSSSSSLSHSDQQSQSQAQQSHAAPASNVSLTEMYAMPRPSTLPVFQSSQAADALRLRLRELEFDPSASPSSSSSAASREHHSHPHPHPHHHSTTTMSSDAGYGAPNRVPPAVPVTMDELDSSLLRQLDVHHPQLALMVRGVVAERDALQIQLDAATKELHVYRERMRMAATAHAQHTMYETAEWKDLASSSSSSPPPPNPNPSSPNPTTNTSSSQQNASKEQETKKASEGVVMRIQPRADESRKMDMGDILNSMTSRERQREAERLRLREAMNRSFQDADRVETSPSTTSSTSSTSGASGASSSGATSSGAAAAATNPPSADSIQQLQPQSPQQQAQPATTPTPTTTTTTATTTNTSSSTSSTNNSSRPLESQRPEPIARQNSVRFAPEPTSHASSSTSSAQANQGEGEEEEIPITPMSTKSDRSDNLFPTSMAPPPHPAEGTTTSTLTPESTSNSAALAAQERIPVMNHRLAAYGVRFQRLMNAHDVACVDAMLRGAYFTKLNYADGKPNRRFVFLGSDGEALFWGKKPGLKEYSTLRLDAIANVLLGPESSTFRAKALRGAVLDRPWLCFSVVEAGRTLDLVAEDEAAATAFLLGLQVLLVPEPQNRVTWGLLLWRRAALRMYETARRRRMQPMEVLVEAVYRMHQQQQQQHEQDEIVSME